MWAPDGYCFHRIEKLLVNKKDVLAGWHVTDNEAHKGKPIIRYYCSSCCEGGGGLSSRF